MEDNNQLEQVYICIENSTNRFLTETEAQALFKQNIYHTYGLSENCEIYIFDYQKNSILPEVKYLDSMAGKKNTPIAGAIIPGAIFLIVLIGIFFYFNGQKESTETINNSEKSSNIEDITSLPLGDSLNISETPQISISNPTLYEQDKEKEQLENEKKQLELAEKKAFTDIQNCTARVIELQTDINISQKNINELINDKNKVLADNNNLINELAEKKGEIVSLNTELKTCNNSLLSENQIYLNIGKDIFEKCEKNNVGYCKDIIYNNIK